MKYDQPAARPGAVTKLRGDAGAIVLLGTVAALYFAREILIPLAFALTLTFLLTPAVALLQRLHIGRVVSVLATVLVSIAVAVGISWVIANQLVDVANQLPRYRQNIHARIDAFHLPVTGQLSQAAHSVQEIVDELGGPSVPSRLWLRRTGSRINRTRRLRPSLPFPFAWSNPQRADGRNFAIWARPFLRR